MNALRLVFLCLIAPLHLVAQEPEPVPQTRPATLLHIDSTPSGARVFINGQEAGYAPFSTRERLDIGDKLQALAHGYQFWTRTITQPVLADTLHIALTRQKARLQIRSDQLDALGAKIRLRFADRDTTFTGFINIGRGNVAYEADLFVGKYRLEIGKAGFRTIERDLFLWPRGKLLKIVLTPAPLPLTSLSIPDLAALADRYRAESAHLLAGAIAIGEAAPAVASNATIHLMDRRLPLFVAELDRYGAHIREIDRTLDRMSEKELGVLRALAQVEVYRGIVLGKYRRFSEAHALFRSARARSPFPVDQEPYPLPGNSHLRLGDLMGFVEHWHDRLGRLDVNVSEAWLSTRNLQPNALYFEQVLFTRESPTPPLTSPGEQAMRDSLVTLAELLLRENIVQRRQAFSLALPQGHYIFKDGQNRAVPVSFRVGATPSFLRVSPRVSMWLPEAKAASDVVRVQPVFGDELGPIVPPDQMTFGQEYAIQIKTGDYKDHRENIVLYPTGGIKPVWPGVTAIAVAPGAECLYYKTGDHKLQTSILSNIPGKRKGLLKYLLIPIVAVGVALAL